MCVSVGVWVWGVGWFCCFDIFKPVVWKEKNGFFPPQYQAEGSVAASKNSVDWRNSNN